MKKKDNPDGRKQFKPFQIRWKEPLGEPTHPYLYRWTFLFFNYSIRIHHWIRSDDKRFFHDHACNFVSIVLKGEYTNVVPDGTGGKIEIKVKAGSIWYAKADQRHYLKIPKGGAWTLLLCGRPWRKWGFWVDGKLMRPLKYFKKYGHPAAEIQ